MARHNMAGGNYCAVIAGEIKAKGRKPDCLRIVRRAKAEGQAAFIGFSLREIGQQWD